MIMAKQELVDYIENTEEQGFSKGDIKKALKSQGWGSKEIKEAMKEAEAKGKEQYEEAAKEGPEQQPKQEGPQPQQPAEAGQNKKKPLLSVLKELNWILIIISALLMFFLPEFLFKTISYFYESINFASLTVIKLERLHFFLVPLAIGYFVSIICKSRIKIHLIVILIIDVLLVVISGGIDVINEGVLTTTEPIKLLFLVFIVFLLYAVAVPVMVFIGYLLSLLRVKVKEKSVLDFFRNSLFYSTGISLIILYLCTIFTLMLFTKKNEGILLLTSLINPTFFFASGGSFLWVIMYSMVPLSFVYYFIEVLLIRFSIKRIRKSTSILGKALYSLPLLILFFVHIFSVYVAFLAMAFGGT